LKPAGQQGDVVGQCQRFILSKRNELAKLDENNSHVSEPLTAITIELVFYTKIYKRG
jgi:hypothetical protein